MILVHTKFTSRSFIPDTLFIFIAVAAHKHTSLAENWDSFQFLGKSFEGGKLVRVEGGKSSIKTFPHSPTMVSERRGLGVC